MGGKVKKKMVKLSAAIHAKKVAKISLGVTKQSLSQAKRSKEMLTKKFKEKSSEAEVKAAAYKKTDALQSLAKNKAKANADKAQAKLEKKVAKADAKNVLKATKTVAMQNQQKAIQQSKLKVEKKLIATDK